MNETRTFSTLAIISLTTGISLCNNFREAHAAAEWLMGHTLLINDFTDKELWGEMQAALLEQHPKMPIYLQWTKEKHLAIVAELEKEFGKTMEIRPIANKGLPPEQMGTLQQYDWEELDKKERKEAEEALGRWLSAALEDQMVCAEMKRDIERWFKVIENEE